MISMTHIVAQKSRRTQLLAKTTILNDTYEGQTLGRVHTAERHIETFQLAIHYKLKLYVASL